jgi:hypothetical protein
MVVAECHLLILLGVMLLAPEVGDVFVLGGSCR